MLKVLALTALTLMVMGLTVGCSLAQSRDVAGTGISVAGENRNPASSSQHLSGTAASDFIEKHFPNADIPGPVEGKFNFVTGRKTGFANCFVPAMGGASEGAEATCSIVEGDKHQTLTGVAAEEFIDKHFPNADIPGPVKGKFVYAAGVKKSGYAKCFYPAMGGASDGAVPTCDVRYN